MSFPVYTLTEVPEGGVGPWGICSANGKIYVADFSNDTVVVIDATTQAIVTTIPLIGPRPCLTYLGFVWVFSQDGAGHDFANQIDPATDTIIHSYPFQTNGGNGGACGDAAGNIWIANPNLSSVTEIVAATGAVVGTFAVGNTPQGVCFHQPTNSIWTVNNLTATKLNAATGASFGNFPIPNDAFTSGQGLAATFSAIWVSTEGDAGNAFTPGLVKLDPATGAVLLNIPLAVTPPTPGGTVLESVNYDGTFLWVVDGAGLGGDNAVFVVDPAINAQVAAFNTLPDGNPLYLAFGPAGTVWVANNNFPTISLLTPPPAAASGALTGTYCGFLGTGQIGGGNK